MLRSFKTITGFALSGIFFLYLISYFNSENKSEYWDILKNKIPFLLIPAGLLSIHKLEAKHFYLLVYVFISCCLFSSLWSFGQYIQHADLYEHLYAQGGVIPTLIHHVSFSVLICFAVLFILNNLTVFRSRAEVILNILLLLWFIYFIHLLSVRTGILLLYISIILFGIGNLARRKKYAFTGIIFLLLISSTYLSLKLIPNMKSKIAYTFYGFGELKNNMDSSNTVSDSRRILSDKIGIEVMKNNKLFGTGTGDLQDEMNKIYKERYPLFKEDVYAHIHNQYLFVLASMGMLAGSLVCIFLLLPLIYFVSQKEMLFSILYLLMLLVMLWEPFLENQLGTSIYLIICCLGYTHQKE